MSGVGEGVAVVAVSVVSLLFDSSVGAAKGLLSCFCDCSSTT